MQNEDFERVLNFEVWYNARGTKELTALFIPHSALLLFDGLKESEKECARNVVNKFYAVLNEYLEKWSKSLDGTEIFCWMDLTSIPVLRKAM